MTEEKDATRLLPGPPAVAKITRLKSRSAALAHEDFAGSVIHELEIEPTTFPSGRPAARAVMDGNSWTLVMQPFGFRTDRGRVEPSNYDEGIGIMTLAGSVAVGAYRYDSCMNPRYKANPDDVMVAGLNLSKLSIATLVRKKRALRGGYHEQGVALVFSRGGIHLQPPITQLDNGAEITCSALLDAIVAGACNGKLNDDATTEADTNALKRIQSGGDREEIPEGVQVVFPEATT